MVLSQYPIRVVSKLTGISIDTLRAWDRRYSVVVPHRTERGRSYTEAQVERLRLVKSLLDQGHSIGQLASLSDESLQDLAETKSSEARLEQPTTPTPAIGLLLQAIDSFDHKRLNEELGRMASLLSPRDVVFQLVLPLMRELGERWHRGEISIAQEHLVSAALKGVLGTLVRLQPAGRSDCKIVLGTLSGDLHEFGILAAAMIASMNGMDPVLLGPNLPGRELASAAETVGAKYVLVGNAYSDAGHSSEFAQLAQGLSPGTSLWVGGPVTPKWSITSMPQGVGFMSFASFEEYEAQCKQVVGWSS